MEIINKGCGISFKVPEDWVEIPRDNYNHYNIPEEKTLHAFYCLIKGQKEYFLVRECDKVTSKEDYELFIQENIKSIEMFSSSPVERERYKNNNEVNALYTVIMNNRMGSYSIYIKGKVIEMTGKIQEINDKIDRTIVSVIDSCKQL